MDEIRYAFGELLRGFRSRAKLTQLELSINLGTSKGTINNWENHRLPRYRKDILQMEETLDLRKREINELLVEANFSPKYDDSLLIKEQRFPVIDQERARAIFSEIPVDKVPDIGRGLIKSYLPFHPNPHFVGRNPELKLLGTMIKGNLDEIKGRTAVITGIGGSGKTQFAVEFAHLYGSYFVGGVFWVNFAIDKDIAIQWARFGGRGFLELHPKFEYLELPQQINIVNEAFHEQIPRLLIFDNCDDEKLLAKWRPKYGLSHVLVTSRKGHWDKSLGMEQLRLETLAIEASIKLLQRFQPAISHDVGADIADELGNLPLALHLAGSYIDTFQVTDDDYLKELREVKETNLLEHPSLKDLTSEYSPTAHHASVAATFAMSFNKLDMSETIDRLALSILSRLVYLAPNHPIETHIVSILVNTIHEPGSRLDILKGISRLVNVGIAERLEDGEISIHRLIQAFTFAQELEEDQSVFDLVVAELVVYIQLLNEQQDIIPRGHWHGHLYHLMKSAVERGNAVAGSLGNSLGLYHMQLADYADAWECFSIAHVIDSNAYGLHHPDVARDYHNMGTVLLKTGNFEGAKAAFEQAFNINRSYYGTDHRQVAENLSNLGEALRELGEYDESQEVLQWALVIAERNLGLDHPHVKTIRSNIALVLYHRGKYKEARSIYEQILAEDETQVGDTHPRLSHDLNNLGGMLFELNEYGEAERAYKRSIQVCEATLGKEHPLMSTIYSGLGETFRKQKKYSDAREAFEKGLGITIAVFGPLHPDVAYAKNGIGNLLAESGELEEALAVYMEALQIFERAYGGSHHLLGIIYNNIGEVHQQQKEYHEAEIAYVHAIKIIKAYDDSHPQLIICYQNMATLFYKWGQLKKARRFNNKAITLIKGVS